MFIQIIEFRTDKIDEVQTITDEMLVRRADDFTAFRGLLARDRHTPGRYFNIVFFDSYESAMKNSRLPIVQSYAAKLIALTDGMPTFYDLEVLEDHPV